MRKEQFLQELETLLWNLPENEREEALQYYRDYFDDAGPENEEAVIRELGSPRKVAQTIKAGVGENDGEFSERGYEDSRFTSGQELGPRTEAAHRASEPKEPVKSYNGWKTVCMILLCILLFPVIFPVGLAVFCVLIGLIAAVIGVAIAALVVAFVLPVTGIVIAVVGIARIFVLPAVGIAMAGVGFLLLAVGMLVLIVFVWCAVKIIPWLIRGIVGLLSYPFRKRKEAMGR